MFYNDHAPPHFHAEYGVSLLGPDEAAELWPFLDETYPGFRHYRTRSEREIPIVQLVPEPQ